MKNHGERIGQITGDLISYTEEHHGCKSTYPIDNWSCEGTIVSIVTQATDGRLTKRLMPFRSRDALRDYLVTNYGDQYLRLDYYTPVGMLNPPFFSQKYHHGVIYND